MADRQQGEKIRNPKQDEDVDEIGAAGRQANDADLEAEDDDAFEEDDDEADEDQEQEDVE